MNNSRAKNHENIDRFKIRRLQYETPENENRARRYGLSAERYATISSAFLSGNTNENKLTDMIFFASHPERNGQKLKRREKALIREWLNIRNNVVRPMIANINK